MRVFSSNCLFWDEKSENWINKGCKVHDYRLLRDRLEGGGGGARDLIPLIGCQFSIVPFILC